MPVDIRIIVTAIALFLTAVAAIVLFAVGPGVDDEIIIDSYVENAPPGPGGDRSVSRRMLKSGSSSFDKPDAVGFNGDTSVEQYLNYVRAAERQFLFKVGDEGSQPPAPPATPPTPPLGTSTVNVSLSVAAALPPPPPAVAAPVHSIMVQHQQPVMVTSHHAVAIPAVQPVLPVPVPARPIIHSRPVLTRNHPSGTHQPATPQPKARVIHHKRVIQSKKPPAAKAAPKKSRLIVVDTSEGGSSNKNKESSSNTHVQDSHGGDSGLLESDLNHLVESISEKARLATAAVAVKHAAGQAAQVKQQQQQTSHHNLVKRSIGGSRQKGFHGSRSSAGGVTAVRGGGDPYRSSVAAGGSRVSGNQTIVEDTEVEIPQAPPAKPAAITPEPTHPEIQMKPVIKPQIKYEPIVVQVPGLTKCQAHVKEQTGVYNRLPITIWECFEDYYESYVTTFVFVCLLFFPPFFIVAVEIVISDAASKRPILVLVSIIGVVLAWAAAGLAIFYSFYRTPNYSKGFGGSSTTTNDAAAAASNDEIHSMLIEGWLAAGILCVIYGLLCLLISFFSVNPTVCRSSSSVGDADNERTPEEQKDNERKSDDKSKGGNKGGSNNSGKGGNKKNEDGKGGGVGGGSGSNTNKNQQQSKQNKAGGGGSSRRSPSAGRGGSGGGKGGGGSRGGGSEASSRHSSIKEGDTQRE